jgi:hypothetical protein
MPLDSGSNILGLVLVKIENISFESIMSIQKICQYLET